MASGEDGWLTDLRTGCRLLKRSHPPGRTIRWSGACSNGVIAGDGRLELLENNRLLSVYNGTVMNGRVTGRGTISSPDGLRIEADFTDGVPSGQATITQPGVGRIEAELVNGKLNGYGVLTASDGTRYEGRFIDNVPDGPVTFTKNGVQTRGFWRKGCLRVGAKTYSINGSTRNCPSS